MGPNYTGNYILDEILRRREGGSKTRKLDLLSRAKKRAKASMPVHLRRRWGQASRRVEERVASGDRQRRTCFTVPHNDIAGAIRINLVGREPHGIVEEKDLDSFFGSLRQDLLEVKNLATGLPIVEDVVRTSDHCAGDYLDDIPDVFVLWRRDAAIERVGSPKIGEIVHPHQGNRTGDHVSDSIFFARGPGIVPGRTDGVSIMDFAPTIAALTRAPLDDTDGEVIPALDIATER
jgi:hypothetical protein